MNSDFWKNRRVFITGHTGFKGSWLALWLQSLGSVVTGYSLLPPTTPNLFDKADVAKSMNSVVGDIRDHQLLAATLNSSRPEIVFHMAAQALVRESYLNPLDTFSTNVMGTVNLLDAVRNTSGIKAIVNITTDKCYENREWIWPYREDEALGGHDPYSASKACSELVTAAYRCSFFSPESYAEHGVAVASARAGNVIGGGDWAKDRLIPDALAAFLRHQPVSLRYPQSIRPWQHVLEPLAGYLLLAENLFLRGPKFAQAWNFGPAQEDAKPVQWLIDRMIQLWGEDAKFISNSDTQPHEAHFLQLDTSKSRLLLAWKPRIPLSLALELTVQWARDESAGQSAKELCLAQIRQYQKLH